ncbi:MAG: FAD:protein FMN transferase [Opitutaceae bacterium]|nr:FAD:protein FMN transferase [Opitutaceae bacterium]
MPASFERFSHEAMATSFDVFIAGHPKAYARQAAEEVFLELDRLESELSRYVESSDISRANRLPRDGSTIIGEDALRCLLISAEISAATDRAFDPAYASRRGPDDKPDDPLYALDPQSHTLISLVERLHLDLGAVGKGYALDCMMERLREWDITTACVQSGGSTVLAMDPPPGNRGWPVGLGEPPAYRSFPLMRRALSGSGLAVKGSHLIDVKSGAPASRTQRTWAFAPTAAVADALSTAFFVMTDDQIREYCRTHADIGAAIATADARIEVCGLVPFE